jgi:hypothetical protein
LAIEKGMTQRTKSEQDVSKRKEALAETAEKMNAVKKRLTRIKTALDGCKKEKIP